MGISVRLLNDWVCRWNERRCIDLPALARSRFANNASAIDLNSRLVGQVDIPRLRKGKVGGFFWSVPYYYQHILERPSS